MTVTDLKTHPTDRWKRTIVDEYPFPPYWWLYGVTPASRQALMGRDLDQALADEKTHLLGYVSDRGDLLGFAQVHRLDWDTDHFGFDIWRLDHLGVWNGSSRPEIAPALAQAVVQVVRERGGQNIQARIPLDDLPTVHVLENAGFRTMEILTTWMFDLAKSTIPSKREPDVVRDSKPADTESLIELARSVYTPIPDRFHVDPHLSPKASNELYAEWMRNSCSGQLADHIAVAENNGAAIGYSTMKYFGDHDGLCNARIAQLGLGGMTPDFRNRGLVTDLVVHNLEWLHLRQADYCFVGTQGNNVPPQRVWLKVGFKPITMAVTFHYWVDDD
jgi:GNAT superfamily N-acetyltransferase